MKKNHAVALGFAGAVALVVGLLYWQLTFLNGAWMLFRGNMGLWLMIFATLGIISVIAQQVRLREGYNYYGKDGSSKSFLEKLPIWPLAVAAVATAGAAVFLGFYGSYAKAAAYNEMNTVVQPEDGTAQFATYDARAPWVVADQQISDNTTINGSPYNTTYIPSEDHYGAFVERKGMFKGYGQVVWVKIDESGQARTSSCSFEDSADKKLNGWLSHNLERAIMRKDFGIKIDTADAYAYCDEEGTPIVVVPFKKYEGFFFPHEVPGGVALYNGKTGEVTIEKNVEEGETPGPVYPLSLAKKALSSTNASEGFTAYVMKSTGFQGYGGENSSEYTLGRADSTGSAYVTPLTRRGQGRAITAVSEQVASSFTAGQLNRFTIAVLPEPRQGDSAVEDRVKADYPDLSWASGIEIFEIAPTAPEEWTATVGLNKAISYRLTIKADSSSCLYGVKGNKLRCTGEDAPVDEPAEPGNDPLDLASLSDDEIIQLQESILKEMEKRLRAE